MFSLVGFEWLANYLFIFLMICISFSLAVMPKIIKQIILHKSFKFYLFLNLINIFYYLLFELGDVESLKYLLSRFAGLSIFAISIDTNVDFYKEKMFSWISNLLIFVCVAGIVINFPSVGRYSGLIGNYNEFGVLMSIAFGFKYLSDEKRSFFDWGLLVFLCVMTIISGSRGAAIGLIIPIFLKDRSIIKPILISVFLGGLVFLLSQQITSETTFERFSSEHPLLHNRFYAFEYAASTFQQKWLSGHGLSHHSFINKDLINVDHRKHVIGAHNGYLAVLVQYGILFAMLFFANLIFGLTRISRFVIHCLDKSYVKSTVFILVYAFFYSAFETVMTGINNFHTAVFWFAFGVLFYESYGYDQLEKK